MEQLGADVVFEAVDLFQQGGALDPDLLRGSGEAVVAHGDGEAFQAGPAAGGALDSASQVSGAVDEALVGGR